MNSKTLYVVASTLEAKGIFSVDFNQTGLSSFEKYDVLITGIGLLNTSKALLQGDLSNYTRIINLGIAGVFPLAQVKHNVELGDLIEVVSELQGDLGAENSDENGDFILFDSPKLEWSAKHSKIKALRGLSVQSCTGTFKTGEFRQEYGEIESMEGFAFAQVMLEGEYEFSIVRAISNLASTRDKDSWKVDLALNNLKEFVNDQI